MEKDNSIIESNKLIAEFMGWYKSPYPNLPNKMYRLENNFEVGCSIDNFKYHTSWSWLMPVVEKINWMNGAQGYSFVIYRASVQVNDSMDVMFEVCADKKRSLLMCVWQAVIQFIQWYNANQTKIKS